VIWTREDDIEWATRWDIYFRNGQTGVSRIHWFNTVNSVLVVLFLSGVVAMIMLRALRRDVTR